MTVVRKYGSNGRADQDRHLRKSRKHRQYKSSEYGVAGALRDHGDDRVAYRLFVLASAGRIEGQRTVEPPGNQCRDRERAKARNERMGAEGRNDGEGSKICGQSDGADSEKSQRPRQPPRKLVHEFRFAFNGPIRLQKSDPNCQENKQSDPRNAGLIAGIGFFQYAANYLVEDYG